MPQNKPNWREILAKEPTATQQPKEDLAEEPMPTVEEVATAPDDTTAQLRAKIDQLNARIETITDLAKHFAGMDTFDGVRSVRFSFYSRVKARAFLAALGIDDGNEQ